MKKVQPRGGNGTGKSLGEQDGKQSSLEGAWGMGGHATDNQLRPELLSSALFKAEKSTLLLIFVKPLIS